MPESNKIERTVKMRNQSSITMNIKTAKSIFAEISLIQKRLDALKEKILTLLPAQYGSNEWWEKEIKEGLEEVKKGEYTLYKNVDDLLKDLHAGK